jgi:saccharopine dehydrogenase-like NADP-dependent oxidoreductase
MMAGQSIVAPAAIGEWGFLRSRRRRRRSCELCCASSSKPSVVIVGGTGRVGLSTARALLSSAGGEVAVTLASRSLDDFRTAVASSAELSGASFREVDLDNHTSLASALAGVDLVIHAAGPFQRRGKCDVLEAALEAGVPLYLDVCDDTDYAQRAKGMHARAQAAGVRAITTGGIFPGVSNVMASEMVRQATAEGRATPERLSFSYFTAGTGGAGPTILTTSLLLCAEDALVYKDGTALRLPPVSGRRVIDFGKAGLREVFLYALPEVMTAHAVLGVPCIAARFGTSPGIWNGAMAAMAAVVPRSVLQDPKAAAAIAGALDPLVRAVDALVGETMAMRVDLEWSGASSTTAMSSRFVHRRLSKAVGTCVAAFARDLLEHREVAPPGVFYPEEGVMDPGLLLQRASEGTIEFALAKAPWQIETKATQLGFGMYL